MQGPYQPYAPIPPGPPLPPRRDRANLVPLFIIIGVLAVALLGTLTYLVVKVGGDDDLRTGTVVTPTRAANPRAINAAFSGTWTGSGYYHNNDGEKRNFDATLTLTEGGETGTSSYTGFVCSGTLRVESVTPDKVVMYEVITQGNEPGGNCSDAATGYVTLTLRSDGTVLYSWYGNRDKMLSGDTSSQATLSRQQSSTTTT
ncbi:hypothetical protein SAMN04489712_1334 [Thermomonospora echinospora]|uniref:Uncharacterized protein n=1 Tax=Thermomonospora echinospora TaxID=1992 RepID=A0A1H6E3R8_9ACTN|nr:hypothetical protein [Thermomonospora echinospora]SEG92282.1 hypothetical protein SAMN04489712_1334 [Thermomonospora echinospora]